MTDIVEKLERLKPLLDNTAINGQHLPEALDEASNEIIRLRAALSTMKERCAKMADIAEREHSVAAPFSIGYEIAAKEIAAAIRAIPEGDGT